MGWKMGDWRGIFAGWPEAYGRPNISPAPIAGWLTLRQWSSIQTSILAVSTVRFARSRSTHGQALMISSAGRSIRRSRLSLGKRSDRQAPQAPWGSNQLAKSIVDIATGQGAGEL